jgi:serine/threonine protein kinase
MQSMFKFTDSDRYSFEVDFPWNSISKNSKPDLVLWDCRKNQVVIPIEVKTKFSFDGNVYKNSLDRLSKSIVKIYTYMFQNNNRYGILTIYEKCWFLERDQQENLFITKEICLDNQFADCIELFVSNAIDHENNFTSRIQNLTIVNKKTSQTFSDLHLIGEGRSGYVFRDKEKNVVLKICDQSKMFKEMVNEVNILKMLNKKKCTFAPKYLDSFKFNNMFIIVIEFIEHTVHSEFCNLTDRQKIKFISTLKQLHDDYFVLHGDIKSENFLFDSTKVTFNLIVIIEIIVLIFFQ